MARPNTNLSESRLARSLVERNLITGEMVEQIFQQCSESGGLLTEALIEAGLITDWELSRVASEAFNLPFLPVDVHPPTERATAGIDMEFLNRWCLVPITRNQDLLTVAIPAAISVGIRGSAAGL